MDETLRTPHPDSERTNLMSNEKASEELRACPQCGQALHDEPVVIDHALRVGLACTRHGVAAVAEPFTP